MADSTVIPTVTVEGYVYDNTNTAVPGAPVYVRLNKSTLEKGNTTFTRNPTSLITNDLGYFSIVLPALKTVTISIPSCNIQKTGLLPSGGTININQLGNI